MFIEHDFITLNEYINKERMNRYAAAAIKKKETEFVEEQFAGVSVDTPCIVQFTWHMRSTRLDPDNVSFAKKFILDGMMKAGAIENDNFKHIKGFVDNFIVDDKVGVEIEFIKW